MKNRRILRLKPLTALLLCFALLASFSGCGSKSNEEGAFKAYYAPLTSADIAAEGSVYFAHSRVLLTAASDAGYKDIEKRVKRDGGEIIGYISTTGDYQIRFKNAKTFEELEQIAAELKGDVLIEDASIDYAARIDYETVNYQNDPWIDADDPSDTSGSVWDAEHPAGNNWWAEAIGMPAVWDMDLTMQTVKVGIIDSMFDTTHEDLDADTFAQIWYNPVNSDGTCKVPQLYSDAVSGSDQKAKLVSAYHGTHIAGIIAAQGDNGVGITGINQNAKLYGYSVCSDEALATDEAQWGDIFQDKCAIAHLLNAGVKVINLSIGLDDALTGTQDGDVSWSAFTAVNSKSMESFLLKYIEAGNEFLIVKSAGNDSAADQKYDAGYDVFGAISDTRVAHRILVVGAAGYNAKYGYRPIADFSNTGSRVDAYAPGVRVLSDIPGNAAAMEDGTSMAAPIVTGLASLIWSINPALSAEQVRSFILASTSATLFDLDDEAHLIRDLAEWISDPTPIVNAEICVKLAQGTSGSGSTPDAEYGTVNGMVYAAAADGIEDGSLEMSAIVDIGIEALSLCDENGELISTIPLQDIAYAETDDDTEEVTIYNLRSYSALVAPGTYTLIAEPEGYEAQVQQIVVRPNEAVKTNFAFTAPGFSHPVDGYIPIVEQAIRETAYDTASGSGFLYDIDGDGIQELLILNICDGIGGIPFPGYAYSIYDLEDGEVITKCEKEVLFYDAGGPAGYVGAVNYAGSTAILVYIDNGETGENAYRGSEYTIYDPDSLQVIVTATLDYVSADPIQVNSCTVDANACSYDDYLSVVNAIEPIRIAEAYDNDASDGSMRLYELLRVLQAASDIMPEQTPQVTKDYAEMRANMVWNEFLEGDQGENWKVVAEESLVRDGVEYYCFTLQTKSWRNPDEWTVFYHMFVNSVTGEHSRSLFRGFS